MNEGRQLLIIGENSLALFDMATEKVVSTRRLDFTVTCTGLLDNRPLLFDSRGRMHQVKGLDNIITSKVPVSGRVTAFVHNKPGQLKAYGMDDGTIWLVYDNGKLPRLAGHQSKVTKLLFFDEGHGRQLYSSSYDGKLFFWMTSDMQIRPITLFQADSWITDFAFSRDNRYVWTSEYNGSVNEHLISLPMIAQRIRQNVKRDFTQEEWNYYVGKEIPYRSFLGNSE
jgi:WD40 repeat protein